MPPTLATLETIPAHLAGHPDGDDIRQWDIYLEHYGMINAWVGPRKTRAVFVNYTEDLDHLAARYDATNTDPSSIGLGRTILAYRLALHDLLPTKPQWAQRTRDNLTRLI